MFRCANIRLLTRFFDVVKRHYHYYPDVDSNSKLWVSKYPLSPILRSNLPQECSRGA